ncbi:MAG TPA: amidase [Candidatus Acidoferrales bacterium]|nr:amidase [Candidatus Acidoferrales bacterium]
MLSDDILYLPIREMGERIRSRQLSPVELAESYLERSEKLGPKYNAYVTITRDLALRQAKAAEQEIAAGHYRGPLHGIPYAVKDLVAVKGYPTTWGARPLAKQSFDYDATVIERLNQAGAVLIGKAAMIELAGGLGYSGPDASLTGPCKNPWNTDYWTCGSSSGPGAVVSAALAPWAIGSDTRGSIICPSAWCGISGMRPSFGRVSRHGAMAIAYSMDKLGPMARTADDCGLALSVMAGHDPADYDSLPAGLAEFRYGGAQQTGGPMRIGRLTNAFTRISPEQEASVEAALKILEQQGAKITDVKIPDGPYEEAAELTILMEATTAYEDLISSGRCAQLEDPLGQINGYASLEFSAADYLRVQRVRTFLQEQVDKVLRTVDVVATAGESGAASPLRENQQQRRARPATPPTAPRTATPAARPATPPAARRSTPQPDGVSSLCGLPALTVPCGFTKNKLPYGIQFMARALGDGAVIAAARAFQSRTDWHKQRPPVPAS